MRVSTAELEALLWRASQGAGPQEHDATERAAAALRLMQTEADLDSAGSRFLANVARTSRPYLSTEGWERLRGVSLYGVDSAYANAIPDISTSTRRIFVFEGLQHQAFYVIELIRVLERLQGLRPNARFNLDGEDLPEALAFSMAGFSILSDAMAAQRLPATIDDMLGPYVRADALTAYRLAMLFVLVHELGHIELGHLARRRTRSERMVLELIEPEALNAIQEDELAADAFALDQIDLRYRAELMPSLVFFFAPYAFMEAFSGGLNASHPLAINRLNVLTQRVDMPQAERAIIVGWIESMVAGVQRMAALRIEAGGGVRDRIEARLPVRRAYEVLSAIKERVAGEIGLLDRPAELPSLLVGQD